MTDDTHSQIPQLYVVVCTRLHEAHGVYPTPSEAVAAAEALNYDASSQCRYVPMPLMMGDHVLVGTRPYSEAPSEHDTHTHGYL